jgi:methylmalonyl-CoA/ethylmalonyl-CoA epimerase
MIDHPPVPRILAFDHTGLAVRSFDRALPLYRDLLGGVEIQRGYYREAGLNWLALRYPNGSVLELVEPVGDDSPLRRFLEEHGEGVHHLTFIADDAAALAADLKARGYRVVGEDYHNPNWQVAYLSPRAACGTVIQLASGADAIPFEASIPDELRARAEALLASAAERERPLLRRFAAQLGLVDAE